MLLLCAVGATACAAGTPPGGAPRSLLGASQVMEVEDRLVFLELLPFWWAWEQK